MGRSAKSGFRGRLVRVGLYVVLAVGAAAVICDRWVAFSASGRVFADAALVRPCETALVLGTKPVVEGGRSNQFFDTRMDAAAGLYRSGRVSHLIVSGDNHTAAYDEPSAMRGALMSRGVPDSAITLDYAGFRTLDSVVRAKSVFGQRRIVVVSQAFHCERAVFIAARYGIDAVGFAAPTPTGAGWVMTRAREIGARVRAVLDACVVGTRPHFDEPPEATWASGLRGIGQEN